MGSKRISRQHTAPCRCSRPDTSAGCSLLLCSPDGTHISHPHIAHCRCTHLGRRRWNNPGLPILCYRRSCRCRVGRYHGHYSFCPHLDKEMQQIGRMLWSYFQMTSLYYYFLLVIWPRQAYQNKVPVTMFDTAYLQHHSIPERTGSSGS